MTVIKLIIVMFLLNGNGSFTKWPLAGVVRAQSAAQVLGLTLSPADFCGEGAAVGRGVAAASVIPAGMWVLLGGLSEGSTVLNGTPWLVVGGSSCHQPRSH